MSTALLLGIDIGTQGARAVLTDSTGHVVAEAEEVFALSSRSREEQSPGEWWQACLRCCTKLLESAAGTADLAQLKAVSVTSTSGTVIPLDAANEPLHDAIMYSDKRSAEEGALCRGMALQHNPEGYTGFNSSSGLSKMVWFVRHFPDKARNLTRWVHAADYITGMLSGRWGVTEYTNALKSGYDLRRLEWPPYLYEKLPLHKEWLPEVVPSGTPVGFVQPAVAAQLRLPQGVIVAAGMTDGCASQIASGAVSPGDWNTTIGTTLVVKGVTMEEIRDPEDRLYNHRHPDGGWMPGGASNIGADWVTKGFSDDLKELNELAWKEIPTGQLSYPLLQPGERFPFIAPEAHGFEPEGLSRAARFAAGMEGVAYVERYAYEMIQKLGGEGVKAVYTAGGASKSDVWLAIRSNVLNLPLYKAKHVNGAYGAAVLAASRTHFTSLQEAAAAMIRIEKEIHPEPELTARYEQDYQRFLQALEEKGWIKKLDYA